MRNDVGAAAASFREQGRIEFVIFAALLALLFVAVLQRPAHAEELPLIWSTMPEASLADADLSAPAPDASQIQPHDPAEAPAAE